MSLGKARWGGVLLATICLLAGGCQGKGEAERREAERLSRLIEKVRLAENSQKSAQLEALRRSGCAHHCRLRSVCLLAYESHLEVLGKIERSRVMAEDPKRAPRAAKLLRDAETQLRSALEKTQDCASLQAELSRQSRTN